MVFVLSLLIGYSPVRLSTIIPVYKHSHNLAYCPGQVNRQWYLVALSPTSICHIWFLFIPIPLLQIRTSWLFILYLFYFWLCRVFVAAYGLSLVVSEWGHLFSEAHAVFILCFSSFHCLRALGAHELSWLWHMSSIVVTPWALVTGSNSWYSGSYPAACGIFWSGIQNPCLYHWQGILYLHWDTRNPMIRIYFIWQLTVQCAIKGTWKAQWNLEYWGKDNSWISFVE